MPSKLYNCRTETYFENEEEQKLERKKRDNLGQKIRYWKKKYGYDLKKSDYEEFNKHVHIIKKIYNLHDFIINYNDKKKTILKEDLDYYVKNYNAIKLGLTIKDYLITLKKIESNSNNQEEK